ncbi:PhnB protein [Paenibacillus phyllosphaerae]|uniref:PhnB protein n=1 Tax=Paenibacillus phyllosphaerae TaxID=274593 RepID=A0A7W5AYL9_9BACL|nr:VOC family protein [Paenibacillus phyllosphaerae]MBB3110701.1 PhnB protein [Paenibacillus phyllosphaerae]
MALLRPYIYSSNASEQAAYYAEVFGGEVKLVTTYADIPGGEEYAQDRVLHLELELAGHMFYLADKKNLLPGNMLDLGLEFPTDEEAFRIFQTLAGSEGSEVLVPYDSMFDGVHMGRVKDRYGVVWNIAYQH